MIRLYDRYRNRGFTVLAVNFWDESEEVVRSYVQQKGIQYPVLLNGGRVGNKYGVQGIPASFYIDPEGRIAFRETGYAQEAAMEAKVKSILPQKQ